MPGRLKGPGKFWNIDPIWGYILLILATNCAFYFSLYFQFDFFDPPPIYHWKLFGPPFQQLKTFLAPLHFAQPPHQGIYEHSLRHIFFFPGGALECQEGYQAHPKIHVKRVIFHSWILYVRNVNRVSNSCKTGLKGYDFKEDLMYLGLFFIQNLCKSTCVFFFFFFFFWNIMY